MAAAAFGMAGLLRACVADPHALFRRGRRKRAARGITQQRYYSPLGPGRRRTDSIPTPHLAWIGGLGLFLVAADVDAYSEVELSERLARKHLEGTQFRSRVARLYHRV